MTECTYLPTYLLRSTDPGSSGAPTLVLLLRSTDPDKCSSGARTLYELQSRRISGAAVVLLSILLLKSQGHCSSRARGVAPQG